MTNASRAARPAGLPAYRLSFLLGAACALREFSACVFRLTETLVARVNAHAPCAGGFGDGYDLVADHACGYPLHTGFSRNLVACFARGGNAEPNA